MSTLGDYERYFEEDGKRYHHILSPFEAIVMDNNRRMHYSAGLGQ
jgi:thiamine biosynthesis lipoprotein